MCLVSCALEFGIECSHGYIPFPSISYFTTKLKPLFQYDWFHIVLQSCLNAIRVFLPSHTTYKSKSQLKNSFDTLNCNINAMTLWFWLNQSAFPVNTTWSSWNAHYFWYYVVDLVSAKSIFSMPTNKFVYASALPIVSIDHQTMVRSWNSILLRSKEHFLWIIHVNYPVTNWSTHSPFRK